MGLIRLNLRCLQAVFLSGGSQGVLPTQVVAELRSLWLQYCFLAGCQQGWLSAPRGLSPVLYISPYTSELARGLNPSQASILRPSVIRSFSEPTQESSLFKNSGDKSRPAHITQNNLLISRSLTSITAAKSLFAIPGNVVIGSRDQGMDILGEVLVYLPGLLK